MAGQSWKARMVLESGGQRLQVEIDNRLPSKAYMDAEVRLRGICFFRHNNDRQALGPSLLVPRRVAVLVTRAPPSNDPYGMPTLSLSNLLRFSPQGSLLHRVHVHGTVTYSQRSRCFWIREGDRGLYIQSDQADQLQIGQEVDVVGFPSYGVYTPILEDAAFRAGGLKPAPDPVKIVDLPGVWQHDADLVELDATLREIRSTPEGWSLLLDWNGSSLRAPLRWPKNLHYPEAWLPGSRVRVAGICSAVVDSPGPVTGLWRPQSFQLLMRDPDDLTILQAPPWWTPKRVIYGSSLMTAGALAAVGGIFLASRRRSKQQELERRHAETEFAAVLTERNRIAREIHDTLAQGLGAVSLQLEIAKNKLGANQDEALKHVELAQQSARESLTDARHSIWNMRSQVLETGDLASALDGILKQQSARADVQVDLQVKGNRRRLSPNMENDLLRVGQEAIINAVKHAQAAKIEVELEFAKDRVCLAVRDNGRGFDPSAAPPSNGCFGLTSMRQRAKALQGDLQFQSEPGKGTVIKLCVPDLESNPSSDP
jgi:signal transduction histidine kinase